ncbi:MAG: hypothetical protein AAF081_16420 [Actinomycetota bacterium]
MTDDTAAFDELVSRYLDAEATADEIARVESDPDLLARADAMRAAIEAVAAPVPIPTADLDRIRAAAIGTSTTSTEVSDLAVARARRLERRNRFVAIAAAFVVLAVAFTAVQAIDGDDDEGDVATESTARDDADDAADDGGDSDALDMFGDDDMAEEAEEEMTDAAAAELDDDMAEAAGPESDESFDADDSATAEAAPGVPLPDPRPGPDLLPDLLDGADSVDTIVAEVEAAYIDAVAEPGAIARADGSFADGLCDAAVALVVDVLGDDIVGVEQAIAELDGEFVAVNVALDLDGGLAIYLHPVGDCDALELVSPELP